MPPERPALPNPAPIETLPFTWNVITPDRVPRDAHWVYIGLTPKEYEKLAKNMAEVRRWIEEAAWRLHYYRGEQDGTPPEGE